MLIKINDFSIASLRDVNIAMIDYDKMTKQQMESLYGNNHFVAVRDGESFFIGKTRIVLDGIPDSEKIDFLMIVSNNDVLNAWNVVLSTHSSIFKSRKMNI